jgi:hypothetical protein
MVTVMLDERLGPFTRGRDLWQQAAAKVEGRRIEVMVENRSAAVLRLER